MVGTPGEAFTLEVARRKATNPAKRSGVLLANARHDPVTGYAWARNVQRQAQRKTRLLTYDG